MEQEDKKKDLKKNTMTRRDICRTITKQLRSNGGNIFRSVKYDETEAAVQETIFALFSLIQEQVDYSKMWFKLNLGNGYVIEWRRWKPRKTNSVAQVIHLANELGRKRSLRSARPEFLRDCRREAMKAIKYLWLETAYNDYMSIAKMNGLTPLKETNPAKITVHIRTRERRRWRITK